MRQNWLPVDAPSDNKKARVQSKPEESPPVPIVKSDPCTAVQDGSTCLPDVDASNINTTTMPLVPMVASMTHSNNSIASIISTRTRNGNVSIPRDTKDTEHSWTSFTESDNAIDSIDSSMKSQVASVATIQPSDSVVHIKRDYTEFESGNASTPNFVNSNSNVGASDTVPIVTSSIVDNSFLPVLVSSLQSTSTAIDSINVLSRSGQDEVGTNQEPSTEIVDHNIKREYTEADGGNVSVAPDLVSSNSNVAPDLVSSNSNVDAYDKNNDSICCDFCAASPCVWDLYGNDLVESGHLFQAMNPDSTSNVVRKDLYQTFSRMHWGTLGKGNRRPLPECILDGIRAAFPNKDNLPYMGFRLE